MQGKKVLKGVRVANMSSVPALYFFRPKVIKAVQAEVWHDLKKGGKVKVPAGCNGIYRRAGKWDAVAGVLAAVRRKVGL